MISKFFIERPVLSNVIAILMILIGGVCLFRLALPNIPTSCRPRFRLPPAIPAPARKP
jgi:HAE1 family hydrophobic/amphiphilic exporter-1